MRKTLVIVGLPLIASFALTVSSASSAPAAPVEEVTTNIPLDDMVADKVVADAQGRCASKGKVLDQWAQAVSKSSLGVSSGALHVRSKVRCAPAGASTHTPAQNKSLLKQWLAAISSATLG